MTLAATLMISITLAVQPQPSAPRDTWQADYYEFPVSGKRHCVVQRAGFHFAWVLIHRPAEDFQPEQDFQAGVIGKKRYSVEYGYMRIDDQVTIRMEEGKFDRQSLDGLAVRLARGTKLAIEWREIIDGRTYTQDADLGGFAGAYLECAEAMGWGVPAGFPPAPLLP